MRQLSRLLLILVMTITLFGCSTVTGWFSSDDEDLTAPAELIDFDASVDIEEMWSLGVGNGQGEGFYRIRPVISGQTLFVAAADGEVLAVNRLTGDELWEVELDTSLSGGVGVYGDGVLLGSSDGFVLKLDSATGAQRWSTPLRGEILSAPQSNGTVVVAQTYDGKLQGLNFASGALLWTYDSNVPVLTIRGTSTPIVDGSRVYAGFGNGRVLAFDINTGAVLWEVRVAISQGRSEIERIVDIDGAMALAGGVLYAASYQGNLVAIDVQSGRKIWQQKASSFAGVSQAFGNVYVADADGTLTAYLRDGQGVRWTEPVLAYRELSRPTPVGRYVAVADLEGYVHFLSQVDGSFVGRVRADSDGVRADMVSDGNILYVYGNSGDLTAYEVALDE
ncbi:MAG: outer membrane protein assembly factor BamB [Halioglobus sp.]|nr:outer membrane protein assembly factor BamB [Halioglobus sp.]